MTGILPFNMPQSFIIFWPGESYKLQWDGDGVTLPGGKDVVTDEKLYRFVSAKDRNGNFVPGTLVLKRIMGFDEKKGEPFVAFEPKTWLEGVFGVDGMSGPCTNMAKRGLRIVNSVDDLSDAMRSLCQEEWEAAQEQSDLEAVAQELGRRARYERDGRQAPPLPAVSENRLLEISHRLAERNVKKQRTVVSTDALKAVLAGQGLPSAMAPPTPAPAGISPELAERIKTLIATAEESKVDISTSELAMLERGDLLAIEGVLARIRAAMPGQAMAATK